FVVSWIVFSFNVLAKLVDPTPKARYVAFESFYDARQMPQAKYGGIDFPYVEGLRLDEAMNPLALLCVGMYGETLPPQDGAPVRIDRKSTRLNSSHGSISYAVFCLKKKI